MAITFRFAGQDRTLSSDEARWLLGQVRTARELTPAAAAVTAKIEQALEQNGVVETTLTEKHELIEALEDALRDEPGWAGTLSVEPVELDERDLSPN